MKLIAKNKTAYITITILLSVIALSISQTINYSVQSNWGGSCGNKVNQSPINLSSKQEDYKKDGSLSISKIFYSTIYGTTRALNTDGNIVASYSRVTDNYIILNKFDNEYKFTLQKISFHCPAEHHIDDTVLACEIQLLHQRDLAASNADATTYNSLIVSILIVGNGTVDDDILKDDMDFSNYLNKLSRFFFYEGSLTYPDCTPNVNWLIRAQSVTVSTSQLTALTTLINQSYPNGNDRNIQTTGERTIYLIDNCSYYQISLMIMTCLFLIIFI